MRTIPKPAVWRVIFWSGKTVVAAVDVLAPTKLLARLATRDALLAPENTLQRERYLNLRHTIDRVSYGRRRTATAEDVQQLYQPDYSR